jgi:glycosyltransferase involved in cell wall biosynthesis
MKILMVLESSFPPDIRVSNEAASLIKAGHDVHIACYKKPEQDEKEELNGLIIHRFSIRKLRHKSSVGALNFSWYFNYWNKRLSKLISQENFDTIHIHDLPLASVASKLKKKYKLKFVLDLHENWPALLNISTHTKTFLGKILCSIPQWEKYEKKHASLADRVIVVVDEAKTRLIELGVDADKISVVSNTLNMGLFDFPEQLKNPDFVTLVYGGGINYHRGLQYAIEAIPLIKEKIPNIRLWIIGDGNYLQTLKTLATTLNVNEYVKFWGWKGQQELLELLSQGDYAIIPHIRSAHTDATIPHKIFQYMYAGIPIISSDCLPLERILKETGTGVCFKDQDAENFAEVFLKLVENSTFLEQSPKSGKEWVMDKYNWEEDAKILNSAHS